MYFTVNYIKTVCTVPLCELNEYYYVIFLSNILCKAHFDGVFNLLVVR